MSFYPRRLMPALFLLFGNYSLAQETAPLHSLDELSRSAAEHLAAEAKRDFPGFQALVEIRPPDPRLRLSQCKQLEFNLAPGAKLFGNGSINVRCESSQPWALYLGYQIKLRGDVLVAKRPLGSRETLQAWDVALKETEFTAAPGKFLHSPQQAIGLVTKRPIQAEQPITLDMLSKPLAVRSGQKVRITVQTPSYTVSQECTAQANATAGELVRCKANNGRMLQGVAADDGTLYIQF